MKLISYYTIVFTDIDLERTFYLETEPLYQLSKAILCYLTPLFSPLRRPCNNNSVLCTHLMSVQLYHTIMRLIKINLHILRLELPYIAYGINLEHTNEFWNHYAVWLFCGNQTKSIIGIINEESSFCSYFQNKTRKNWCVVKGRYSTRK